MSSVNDIISEIKTLLENDTDISNFCTSNYGKEATVKTGGVELVDLPIDNMPVIVASDNCNEREKRRFLFSDKEANLVISCGILQNDTAKAETELISFKEAVKLAFKKDPLLNDKAVYSIITKSRRLRVVPHPLYFVELSIYVNYRTS